METIKIYAQNVADEIEAIRPGLITKVVEVTKNNGCVYTGISIHTPDTNVSPTVYVNDEYQAEISVSEAARFILRVYDNSQHELSFDVEELTNYSSVKDKLRIRIIGRSDAYLDGKPYRNFLDLAIVYYLDLGSGMSTVLTNEMLKAYDITADELHKVAVENTKQYAPAIPTSMFGTLRSMGMESPDGITEDNDPITVWTNKDKLYGASALLIADFGKEPRYIIPSSIHEILSVKIIPKMTVEDIRDMVQEINNTKVGLNERLSYSVYYWDGECLSIAK